jgi:hypothetical protein
MPAHEETTRDQVVWPQRWFNYRRLYGLTLLLTVLLSPMSADAFTPEQEAWLEDESEQRARAVNEGNLVFLPGEPDPAVLSSDSKLIITPQSINTGWVELYQCYAQLDAVAAMQVEYQYKQLRNLQLLSAVHIGKAWIDGQTVQLEDVEPGATLCIHAQVRIFYRKNNRTFSLVNGPFHRRFLDGYYPYHVILRITYPDSQLEFFEIQPPPQPGFSVSRGKGNIHIEAWFEGVLNTETRFVLRP